MTTGEIIAENIKDLWEQAESYNFKNVLTLLKDISEKIETTNSTKLGEEINEYINEQCEENNICPDCFTDLEIVSDKIDLNYCPNCGWNEL
jgi:hypothetical protein